MGRYLKFIGFLVLAFIVWQTSGAAFADGSSAGAEESMDIRTVPVAAPHQEEASNNGHVQLLTMSRIQRSYITEYIFSLKDWVDKIAQREAVLSLHREKLFDATAYYRCQPVCEYYIFALRRILI